jgi:hypothetical protein
MMFAKKTLLVALCALLAPLAANAQVVNGSFETGDFSGWTLFGQGTTYTSSVGVTPTAGTVQGYIDNTGNFTQTAPDIVAALGVPTAQIAAITTGTPTRGTALYQDVTVSAGQTLSFDWNFTTSELDQDPSFDDFAFYTIAGDAFFLSSRNAGSFDPLLTPPVDPLMVPAAGFNGITGWTTQTYTFPSAGTFRVGFGVLNVKDAGHDSALLLDNISISVPEPCTGLLALSSILMLKRQRRI